MHSAGSSWLILQTGHGLWDWAGLIGGFLLGLVTVFGGFVALKSFLASTQAASHAHMHQMFLRFLEARNAFSAQLKSGDIAPERHGMIGTSLREDLDFGGSVLYFLEEVFAWTVAEETSLKRWWMKPLMLPGERRRKMDIVRSWRATILTQLLAHRADVLNSLKGYSSCYGCDFLSFAAMIFDDADLNAVARNSNRAVRNGRMRPMGSMERRQQHELRHRAALLEGFEWRRAGRAAQARDDPASAPPPVPSAPPNASA